MHLFACWFAQMSPSSAVLPQSDDKATPQAIYFFEATRIILVIRGGIMTSRKVLVSKVSEIW